MVNIWKIGAWPGWPCNKGSYYKNKKNFIRVALRNNFVAIGWSDCKAENKTEKQIREECKKCGICRSNKSDEFINFTKKIRNNDIILLYNYEKIYTGVAKKRRDGKIHYETTKEPIHRIDVDWLYHAKPKKAKFSWYDTVHKIEDKDLPRITDKALRSFLQNKINEKERLPEETKTRTKEAVVRKYGAGGEGIAHKELKDWVAENPDFLGLDKDKINETQTEEHVFLSGDLPDIIFICDNNKYVIVEVETTNPLPGAYQAIKYRSLLCAELGIPLDSMNVKSFLVTKLSSYDVEEFCRNYQINLKVKKM